MNKTDDQVRSTQAAVKVEDQYDCVVIGAGVAGGLASYQLASAGARVLIVEAQAFPREKVCGCCLNQRGQEILKSNGIYESVLRQPSAAIARLRLLLPNRTFDWPTPMMLTMKRSSLDSVLVNEAIKQGAEFRDDTRAEVLPEPKDDRTDFRIIALKTKSSAPKQKRYVSAKIVLAADGLTQSSLSQLQEFNSQIKSTSRIGVQVFLPQANLPDDFCSILSMVVAEDGYVGIAPVDAATANLAAAIDPQKIASGQRPWQVVEKILSRNGVSISQEVLSTAHWRATPPLTRRSSRCGSRRIFLIGDTLGYVEPFTGEGMSWAMTSASLVQRFLKQGIAEWSDDLIGAWQRELRVKLSRQQWLCSQLSKILRNPRRANLAAEICQRIPRLRKWAMQKVSVG